MTPSATSDETLAALLEAQRQTNQLLRVLVMPRLRQAVSEALGSNAERRAYEASDGTRTVREVAKASGASVGSVSGWGKKWRRLGIADETAGRTRHVMPPSALGINLDEEGGSA
jgi:hypothetical protein